MYRRFNDACRVLSRHADSFLIRQQGPKPLTPCSGEGDGQTLEGNGPTTRRLVGEGGRGKPPVAFSPVFRTHVLEVRSAPKNGCGLAGRTLRKDSGHAFLNRPEASDIQCARWIYRPLGITIQHSQNLKNLVFCRLMEAVLCLSRLVGGGDREHFVDIE